MQMVMPVVMVVGDIAGVGSGASVAGGVGCCGDGC